MPDDTLSLAIKEAYASAPSNLVIHHTLEIWHPNFTTPIRVVRDHVDLTAKLESSAPRNASQYVTFVGYAFDEGQRELQLAPQPLHLRLKRGDGGVRGAGVPCGDGFGFGCAVRACRVAIQTGHPVITKSAAHHRVFTTTERAGLANIAHHASPLILVRVSRTNSHSVASDM